jgi:hypothetical protein
VPHHNHATNKFLACPDKGFAPIGEILSAGEGYGRREMVEEFYTGHGERAAQEKMEKRESVT